jgi:tight adherence protein B
MALGAFLPLFYLSFKASRRIKAFNGGLAETLQIIAGGLQAGLSLSQAIDTVVKEGGEPIASEFQRAIIEQRLGVEIEDSLETVAERMNSVDFKWVVMAIRIQREVGGNLAELLLTVSATLREREYLRRQVAVLSAEGRLSAWILGGLPPFFVAYLTLTRPTYVAPMFHTHIGWIMCAVGVAMMLVGAFWLKKAVKVVV